MTTHQSCLVVVVVCVLMLLLLNPETYSLVKIRSTTADILLTLSLCWCLVGGGGDGVQSNLYIKPNLYYVLVS